MVKGKLTVISKSGGKFTTNDGEGTLSYSGGEAHALSVNNETRFVEMKSEIAEMWKYDPGSVTVKYFLPMNKRTLVTISSDKDVQHMIDFHQGAAFVDVYVMNGENPTGGISSLPCSGSSRTAVAEPCTPLNMPPPAVADTGDNRFGWAAVAESCTPLNNSSTTIAGAGDNRLSWAAVAEPCTPLNNSSSTIAGAGDNRLSWAAVAEPCTPQNILPTAIADAEDNRSTWTAVAEACNPLNIQSPANSDAGDNRQHKLITLWENGITGVHQQFTSVQDFRDTLRKYSVAHGFRYTYKFNDDQFAIALCKGEGCPWRLHAARMPNTPLFRIRKMNNTHTCGAGTSTANRSHASNKLVASIVKEMLQESPKCSPKEIANVIRQDFGIELRYSQAWRGVETVREELQSSYKYAYNQLPWLCEKILETNPGSVATLITREDLSFHRFFFAFHTSLHGFLNGCRPLLFLNTLTLKSKYQSELLTASALDGNNDIFPVAFAVVDVVNDDNWRWFLVQLKSAFSTSEPITFVADRQMGLKQAISSVFSNSYHGYCLDHLTEELKGDFEDLYTMEVLQVIIFHLYDAAYAATVEGFSKCVERIKNVSPGACEWILQSEPEHWANALFEGSRYNQIKSEIAQSFYSWITELPLLPITQMFDSLCLKMMELIDTRRVDSNKWSTRLTPSMEDKLQKEIDGASSLQVLFSPSNSTFQVCDYLGASYIVNIDLHDCSCREWQITGLPCSHAVTVLQRFDRDIYNFCSKFLMADSFRLIYSESIHQIPTADKPVQKKSSPILVHPPPLRHVSGQPKKRRDRNRSKGMVRRPLHCSRCKGVGHNRATCHITS